MIYLILYLYISFSLLILFYVKEKNGKIVFELKFKNIKEYIITYLWILIGTPIVSLVIILSFVFFIILTLFLPINFIISLIYNYFKKYFQKS